MKAQFCLSVALLGALLCGCQKDKPEDTVVSQRFIHKYGYAVSKEDWQAKNYPGQIITHLSNGVTVTATYENGVKHGSYSQTFPHSQTIESFALYNQGNKVKEILYNITGMPTQERVQLSPSRYCTTLWYKDGSPLSIEEYSNEELLEGEYFTATNEVEARVEKGNGSRIRRDQNGLLLSKDEIVSGYMVKSEAFYPTGSPESITHYAKGQLHGEKRSYNENGEPKMIEEWGHGQLHGLCTYFNNGTKFAEVAYLFGQKNGVETNFIDGQKVQKEISWENDKRHGPSIFYVDNSQKTEWYYDGKLVSKERFEENRKLDEMITQISPDVKTP
jgi:antitoxin component YwqK of YwqJK toxin-antitoxin module